MKKTIIMLVPVCCLLSACAAPTQTPTQTPTLTQTPTPSASFIRNCPQLPTHPVCPRERNNVKIHITAAGIQVTPPFVCASPGTTITAEVTKVPSVPDDFEAATIPKDAADWWILNWRTGEGTMSIDVPVTVTMNTDHPYAAMSSTGQCVDPIFHVN